MYWVIPAWHRERAQHFHPSWTMYQAGRHADVQCDQLPCVTSQTHEPESQAEVDGIHNDPQANSERLWHIIIPYTLYSVRGTHYTLCSVWKELIIHYAVSERNSFYIMQCLSGTHYTLCSVWQELIIHYAVSDRNSLYIVQCLKGTHYT